MWEALSLVVQIFIAGLLGWMVYQCFRVKGWISRVTQMDCDEIIEQLLAENAEPSASCSTAMPPVPGVGVASKREQLAALAAGGQTKQCLGRVLVPEQIDSMSDEEVEKLYIRYETWLGAAITKTLGNAILRLYALVAGTFLPIPPENQPKLVTDLEADPFIGHALSSATCQLYHKYGMFLAPVTTALATLKHCQFELKHKLNNKITDEYNESEAGATGIPAGITAAVATAGATRDPTGGSPIGESDKTRAGKRPQEGESRPGRGSSS